jgi:CBS domain-containing membrane protein
MLIDGQCFGSTGVLENGCSLNNVDSDPSRSEKEIEMQVQKVRDLMTRELLTLGPEEDLATVRDQMLERRIRHLPIVDQRQRLVGLVSHRDLLRQTLMERPGLSTYVEDSLLSGVQASEVMVRELHLANPEMDMRQAARLMLKHKIGCLPVVDDGALVGILTEADFLRAVLFED